MTAAAVLQRETVETRLDRELADVRETARLRRARGGRRARQASAKLRLEQSAGVSSIAEREAFHRVYAACGDTAVGLRRVEQAAGILRMLRERGAFDQRTARGT